MFYLKNRHFTRWAKQNGITDQMLCAAIDQFEKGLFEVSLGNHLFKKRIALPGKGKSGGARTILFYQKEKKLLFCFGFNKNEQDNLTNSQTEYLHKLSDSLQMMPDEILLRSIKENKLITISKMEDLHERQN